MRHGGACAHHVGSWNLRRGGEGLGAVGGGPEPEGAANTSVVSAGLRPKLGKDDWQPALGTAGGRSPAAGSAPGSRAERGLG